MRKHGLIISNTKMRKLTKRKHRRQAKIHLNNHFKAWRKRFKRKEFKREKIK